MKRGRSAVPNIWYKTKKPILFGGKDDPTVIGVWIFSFDKTTEFNMFHDYPYKLTKEQKQIFDKKKTPNGRTSLRIENSRYKVFIL